jgi:phosphoribosyl 1,2-cyclic phosphate phosphodiesterase
MKLTVLGSGTSSGVPVIGCSCPVCTSEDSHDKRMRCSLYIEGAAGEKAVIDTGPDFRLQALKAGITKLDAVFLTHAHADHVHGLDDVRTLSWERPIPIYGNRETIKEFRERFSYIFNETQRGGGKPRIETHVTRDPVKLGNLVFTPIPVKHGRLKILGWKISEGAASAVYLTDTSYIPAESFALLTNGRESGGQKPSILIVGGLRVKRHETHFSFEEALDAAVKIGVGKTYITHIAHHHSHSEIADYCKKYALERGLAESFAPAWDGLEAEV